MITKDSFSKSQKILAVSKKIKVHKLVVSSYNFVKSIVSSIFFFILLIFYFVPNLFVHIQRLFFIPKSVRDREYRAIQNFSMRFVNAFNKNGQIGRWDLIDLAFKNMFNKKARTLVTVGGMAIGIGSTVFLLSIGYGAEKLVKSKVASLNEIKQASFSTVDQKSFPLNNKFLSDVSKIDGVDFVEPLVSVVGKVDYKGSQVDVVVYGATTKYLKSSDIQLIQGDLYKEDDNWQEDYQNPQISLLLTDSTNPKAEVTAPDVAGAQQPDGVVVDSATELDAPQTGDSAKDVLGAFTSIEVPKTPYEESGLTINQEGEVLGDSTSVSDAEVLPSTDIVLQENASDTLNENKDDLTQSAILFGSNEINLEDPQIYELFPELKTEVYEEKELEISPIMSKVLKKAVVTEPFLDAIGMTAESALNKEFNISYTVVGDLIPGLEDKKINTINVSYTIVGVIKDSVPYIYIPLTDLKTLGIQNYSEAKVVAKSEKNVPSIRELIEASGYETQSVQDTLQRIETLFASLRVALLFLGILALSVAALGVFNTLTVSLLERTHEVGLLKSLGMKSSEVKEMFLAESLILGFFGGVAGVLVGFMLGKVLDLLLSTFSISSGIGAITVTYIPPTLLIFVLVLSFFIGVITGMYPSHRATKISALDALRYE